MQTRRTYFGTVVAVLLAAGCGDTPFTAPAEVIPDPQFASAEAVGSQVCHAVQGMIYGDVSDPTNPVAVITGDLEGSTSTMLGPDPVGETDQFFTGRAIHISGTRVIEVTGSVIPELVGVTLTGTLDTRAIHMPPIRRVSGTLTFTSGASGHLTTHGILDLITLTTSFAYEGVVCS